MKKCEICNAEMPLQSKFCPDCGAAQKVSGSDKTDRDTQPAQDTLSSNDAQSVQSFWLAPSFSQQSGEQNTVSAKNAPSAEKQDDVFGFDETPAQNSSQPFTKSQSQFDFQDDVFGQNRNAPNQSGNYQNAPDQNQYSQTQKSQQNPYSQNSQNPYSQNQGGYGQGTGFLQGGGAQGDQLLWLQHQQSMAGAHKKARFIFINSIVFLVLMAIRTISSCSDMGTYATLSNHNPDLAAVDTLAVLLMLFALACDVCLIVMIVFSNKGKKPGMPPDGYFSAGKALFVATITNLVFAILYGLFELYITSLIFLVLSTVGAGAFGAGAVLGTFIFNTAFFVFSIINIVRAVGFKRQMKAAAMITPQAPPQF